MQTVLIINTNAQQLRLLLLLLLLQILRLPPLLIPLLFPLLALRTFTTPPAIASSVRIAADADGEKLLVKSFEVAE